jgi:hypothetical protein
VDKEGSSSPEMAGQVRMFENDVLALFLPVKICPDARQDFDYFIDHPNLNLKSLSNQIAGVEDQRKWRLAKAP